MKRSSGFTLIEVMVALAITALALAAGVKASGALVGSVQRQVDLLVGQQCAENEIVRIRLSRQLPSVGDVRFSCNPSGDALPYEGVLTVRPTPNVNFRRVDAKVYMRSAKPSDDVAVIELEPQVARISTVVR